MIYICIYIYVDLYIDYNLNSLLYHRGSCLLMTAELSLYACALLIILFDQII
jgi:hypothetical protein